MRPVVKGEAPVAFTAYRQARDYLMQRIGAYCSYCEMRVTNMIEVEHVIPMDNGGEELSWENFLLACRYCNGNKGKNNQNRDGYLWPDRDNTDLAFRYSPDVVIQAVDGPFRTESEATIELMGLDRSPMGTRRSTPADMRPAMRLETYIAARGAKADYVDNPVAAMASLVGRAAQGFGFYSIWMTVFADYPEVQQEIRAAFPGTYTDEDETGVRIVRPGGII